MMTEANFRMLREVLMSTLQSV